MILNKTHKNDTLTIQFYFKNSTFHKYIIYIIFHMSKIYYCIEKAKIRPKLKIKLFYSILLRYFKNSMFHKYIIFHMSQIYYCIEKMIKIKNKVILNIKIILYSILF